MVLVTNSWRMWLVGVAVSLGIFALLYLTVIRPNTNTANQAIKSGMQQSQQALDQAQKQLGSATRQASATATQTQQTLAKAQKLTSCVAAAGTDPTKLQACKAHYAK